MARPTKLTPEVQLQITVDIEAGNLPETCAQAAGIDRHTFRNWMRWGAEGKEPYDEFFTSVACARARREMILVASVVAGDGQGEGFGRAKAAAFLLERTEFRKFAQRVNVKVQDELELMLSVAERVLDQSNFIKLAEALADADSRGIEDGVADYSEPTTH